jgi:Tol biopolymer transport system component
MRSRFVGARSRSLLIVLIGVSAIAGVGHGSSSSGKGGSGELLVFRVRTAAPGPRYDLVLTRANGRVVRVVVGESRRPTLQPALFQGGSWVPDGRRFAFTLDRRRSRGRPSSATDVYVVDASGARLRRLTTSGTAFAPVWAPDGRAIAYAQRERGQRFPFTSSLWIMNSDGSSKRRLLSARNGQIDVPGSWSPDGRLVAFTRSRFRPATLTFRNSIVTVRRDGSNVRTLMPNAADPAYSPDGRRLAYSSPRDRNGKLSYGDRAFFASELYVSAADGSRPYRLTHTRGLNERVPAWSPDGQVLAFQRGRVTDNAEATEVLIGGARGGSARPVLSDQTLRTWWAVPAWRPRR